MTASITFRICSQLLVGVAVALCSPTHFSAVAVGFEHGNNDEVPDVADTGGSFQAPELVFDFGVQRSDDVETVTHTFRFKNSGTGNLLITGIEASCECTSSIVSATDLAPREEATLTAAMDLHGKMGVSSASIEVRSNDPDNPARTFAITGTVLNLWRVVPAQLDLGDLGKGETRERNLKVLSDYFENETPHRITAVRCDDPAVRCVPGTVEAPQPETGQKFFAVERNFKVEVKAGKELGQHSARLLISTDDPRGVTQVVEVKWNVEGDLSLSTKRVIVLKRGNTMKPVNLAIKSRSGVPFEVLSIDSESRTGSQRDLVFAPLPSNSATEKTFQIDLAETVKPGRPNVGEIVIRTNHPEQKELSIPYTASYIAPR